MISWENQNVNSELKNEACTWKEDTLQEFFLDNQNNSRIDWNATTEKNWKIKITKCNDNNSLKWR